MARNTKYTPELARIVCDAIACYGTHLAGMEAGGVAKTTFYRWMKEFREFRDSVAQAEAEYLNNRPDSQRRKALQIVNDYLNGDYEQVWTTNEVSILPDGNEVRKISVKKVKFPCPPQILDRVLGKPIVDINEAIAVVERYGLKVVAPNDLQLSEGVDSKESPQDSL